MHIGRLAREMEFNGGTVSDHNEILVWYSWCWDGYIQWSRSSLIWGTRSLQYILSLQSNFYSSCPYLYFFFLSLISLLTHVMPLYLWTVYNFVRLIIMEDWYMCKSIGFIEWLIDCLVGDHEYCYLYCLQAYIYSWEVLNFWFSNDMQDFWSIKLNYIPLSKDSLMLTSPLSRVGASR